MPFNHYKYISTILIPTKLARLVAFPEGSLPIKLNVSWSPGLSWLHNKLKISYLHNHHVYGHQTLQGGNLPWGSPVMGHMIHWSRHLARSRNKLKTTNLHYHNASGLVSCNLHLCNLIYTLPQDLWSLNLADCWLLSADFKKEIHNGNAYIVTEFLFSMQQTTK